MLNSERLITGCLKDKRLNFSKLHTTNDRLPIVREDRFEARHTHTTATKEGHESTAVTVKWALYLIGLYPEVQEKIHQELDSVLGSDSEGPLSIDHLKELKYLDCVLKECNRLYPPAGAIARKISEDISICGYKIPKRTHVIVAPFFVHRDEDVFPDPEKFDPERFLAENSARIPDCATRLAEMEVKILVCHIPEKFLLHSDSEGPSVPIIKTSVSNRLNRPHQVSTQTNNE
ncbi:cytochrome P450 4V2 [Caerostris darwini]|uniref:Cytochrome P450 4V2 n=1 Tax=Caerostris darwini TaxID=1538125 RepID=A0AAV4TUZ4_9ARAC|nr:cytochrome P450 4V2 [Caerostris darwini]